MFHFTYMTTHTNGKYYVGRHSTQNLEDNYLGSGKWIRSIKDKTQLKREIISFYNNHEDLLNAEKLLIREHIDKDNCMNFNNSSVGFGSGKYNPNSDPNKKEELRLIFLGDKNPAKRPEVRQKMSEAQKGKRLGPRKLSPEGIQNIINARRGRKYTEEGKKKLSEARKLAYANGTRKPNTKSGWTHSEESKKTQSELAKKRPKYQCIHCGTLATIGPLTRFHNDKCKHRIILKRK